MAFNITGLSSGLDWSTMISKLVAVERKPITALETNKTALSAKKSAWNEVNTKLLSLKTAATDLSARNDFDVFKPSATVSGTSNAVGDLVSFAAGSNAAEGTYSLKVNQLATAQKFASTDFDSTSAALEISGTLTINDHEVSMSATDTLADIRSKINALNYVEDPIGVTASIIGVSDSEYRLTLTSNATGAEDMTITDGTGFLGLTEVVAGQDAEIVVDGFTITRSSNTITDVIGGVTLNLVGAEPAATVTLNINRDYDGVKEKIKAFVDAYNGLMTYIADQGTASGDGKTTKPLFADSSLRSVKTTLRSVILSEVSGLDSTINRLSAIGISIDKTGQLSIDDDTLNGYLKTNFNDVVNLFAAQGSSPNSDLTYIYSGTGTVAGDYEVEITHTGVDVAGRIRAEGADEWMTMTGKGQTLTGDDDQDVDGLVIRYAGTGTGTFDFTFIQGVGEKIDQALYSMTDRIDGYVATKQTSLQSQMDKIDKKIANMEVRLTRYQETLTAKYSAMEAMLSTLQSQQSWLTSQINSLPSSKS